MNKRYYEHTLSTTREFIEYLLIYQFHRKLRIYLWRTFLSAWTVLSLFRGKALLYW